jgi:hypothetical protein
MFENLKWAMGGLALLAVIVLGVMVCGPTTRAKEKPPEQAAPPQPIPEPELLPKEELVPAKEKGKEADKGKQADTRTTPTMLVTEFRRQFDGAQVKAAARMVLDFGQHVERLEGAFKARLLEAEADLDLRGFFERGEPDSEFYADAYFEMHRKNYETEQLGVIKQYLSRLAAGEVVDEAVHPDRLRAVLVLAALKFAEIKDRTAEQSAKLRVITNLVRNRRGQQKPPPKKAVAAEPADVAAGSRSEPEEGSTFVSYRPDEPTRPAAARKEAAADAGEGAGRAGGPAFTKNADRLLAKYGVRR